MIIVTSNKGKYDEFKQMMEQNGIALNLVLMSYPEEQLDTIEEVAERSLCYLKGIIKDDFFIDDSGLFIEELKGFPGVYSSYVKRTLDNEGILRLMDSRINRKAEFKTCIAYYDGHLNLFTGVTRGSIAKEMKGKRGFGFDPIFIPEGRKKTYAEMTLEEKNSISHRSKATLQFLNYLKKKKI